MLVETARTPANGVKILDADQTEAPATATSTKREEGLLDALRRVLVAESVSERDNCIELAVEVGREIREAQLEKRQANVVLLRLRAGTLEHAATGIRSNDVVASLTQWYGLPSRPT